MRINNKDYYIAGTPESLYNGVVIRLNDGNIVHLESEEIKEIVDHFKNDDYIVLSYDEYDKQLDNKYEEGHEEGENDIKGEIDNASEGGYKEGFDEAKLEAEEKIKEIEYIMQEQIDDLTKQIEDLEEIIGDIKEKHQEDLKKEYFRGKEDGYSECYDSHLVSTKREING